MGSRSPTTAPSTTTSRIGSATGTFTFDDVAAAIADKLVRRHPHVFETGAGTTSDLRTTWENHKAEEHAAKANKRSRATSILDDVPLPLPALTRAEKLQKRAARVGFDWSGPLAVLDKVAEEITELRAGGRAGGPVGTVSSSLGGSPANSG